MKLHDFTKVREKILRPMVAGIEVIFVLDAISLKVSMQFRGSLIKSEFVLTAAVEVNGQL